MLAIDDWNFLTYPKISIATKPPFLPLLMPHVSSSGTLCYFAPGSIVLDRYDPAASIAQCLKQATGLLDRIAVDPTYRDTDIQDEFLAHWGSGAEEIKTTLIGTVKREAESLDYYTIKVNGRDTAIIASDAAEVKNIAASFGSEDAKSSHQCWVFRTEIRPTIPAFFPTTVSGLFDWLRQWDGKLYRAINQFFEKNRLYLQYKFVSFALKTPVGWFGFCFSLDQVKRLSCTRYPVLYRQFLHGKGGRQKIFRLSILDISPEYVHSRNLMFPDLQARKVVLIGCGAIGSFIAQCLVRLGAGSGGGSLVLVDPDSLSPDNIGRHLLGYPSLFKSKSIAVASELTRQFPNASVIGVNKNILDFPNVFSADLVIDGTGEEAVGEYLNALRLEQETDVPLLHAWIMGNGECVQVLWAEGRDGGCLRCLKLSEINRYRAERYPVLNKTPTKRSLGCQSFTPYAVSAPMAAASLVIDIVSDWLRGNPSPRFRTRTVENADVRKVKNQDISKLQGCVACGSR